MGAMEGLKKQPRAIDLAVAAGQKRLSPRTSFVHLYPHDEYSDTIPLYENFCFAFALLRQKTAESVTAAKELIERLLAFQTLDGNFPVYLHEFPKAHDFHLGLKIGAILKYCLRLFPTVLGDLRGKIEAALENILSKQPEKLFWKNRYSALKDLPIDDVGPIHDWTEWLITAQLANLHQVVLPYDANFQLFKVNVSQEKGEPRPHPIEWLLAEGHYSPRLLKDHPHQLLAAPLFPIDFIPTEHPELSFRLYWQGTTLHSLVGDGLIFDLGEKEMGRNDLFEALLYCDRSSETVITVGGKRATTFHLGDKITIHTPEKTIELIFLLTAGEGDFCGHIFPANRPSQIAKGYTAYDWQIGLRTLRRSTPARIEIRLAQW